MKQIARRLEALEGQLVVPVMSDEELAQRLEDMLIYDQEFGREALLSFFPRAEEVLAILETASSRQAQALGLALP